jgi:hypothetical protein
MWAVTCEQWGNYYLERIYLQIWITYEDVEKMACRTRSVFLVIPFGLCDASSTFTIFMNTIFRKEMDDFVIIYSGDILVYSKTVEHVRHLEAVLQRLRVSRTSTWGVPATPWAQEGPRSDTKDLWCHWWEGPSDHSLSEGLGCWERLPPTEIRSHEGKDMSQK